MAAAWAAGVATRGHAQAPPARWVELPFAQRLDMSAVEAVVGSAPQHLLATIARFEVDLRLVRSAVPQRAPNPLLATVPPATEELIRCAEFRDTYEGRVVMRGAARCPLARDTLLIRETASTYTLLHEFVQSRLEPTDGGGDDGEVELRFTLDLRRLAINERCVLADPHRLLEPHWRDDILDALAAVAEALFQRIQIGQSQEAIVEKVLRAAIAERSPYYDAARAAQGRRYGEAMIDNAIDLFNRVHGAVGAVREAVHDLRREVRAGSIALGAGARLTDDDVAATDEAAQRIERELSRVRTEIAALKQFYVR